MDTNLDGPDAHYAGDLFGKVGRYVEQVGRIADEVEFGVIHAHDWMTFPAGIAVHIRSGKPLVVHVHSTEFDRSGEDVNPEIFEYERAGMHAAQCVIAVSYLTQRLILERYAVDPRRVRVVYNAVDEAGAGPDRLPAIAR